MNVITHSRSAVYCNEWPGWRNFWNLKAAVPFSHMLQLHYAWVRNSKLLSTTHHLWNVFGNGYENCAGMYHVPWVPSIVHPVWVACWITDHLSAGEGLHSAALFTSMACVIPVHASNACFASSAADICTSHLCNNPQGVYSWSATVMYCRFFCWQ